MRKSLQVLLITLLGATLAVTAVVLLVLQHRQLATIQRDLGRISQRLDTTTATVAAARQDALEARQRAESAAEQAAESARQRDAAVEAAARTRTEMSALRRRREEEMGRLERSLARVVATRRTALGVTMNLDEDFLQFDFDRAELRPRNRELLSRIAGILMTSGNYRIEVFGHTDDVGTDEYNRELSERRAEAVRDYLVEAGIDPGIITIQGFGKSRPLVTGTSAEARAQNRRVEIGIIDALIQYRAVQP